MLRLLSPDLVRSGFVRASDDVHLYWRAVGQGPLLVCCNGVGVSTFFWKYIVEHFQDRYTVVVWDYRGHGRSDRKLDPATADLSIVRHADDLKTVLYAVRGGFEPAILLGHSMGCQVVLEFQRRYPDRVRAMVLQQGTAGHVLDTFFGNAAAGKIVGAVRWLANKGGRASNFLVRPLLLSPITPSLGFAIGAMDPDYTAAEDLRNYLKHLGSLDQRLFLECVWQAQLHSAWDMLPTLHIPVLVIGAENDTFTPLPCSKRVAAMTPGAELFVLAHATHAALIEQPLTINHRLERFLRERVDQVALAQASK